MSTAQAGEQILLKVENLSHNGEGVGRFQGQVVFIPRVLPGEEVRAKVVEARKKYLRAELEGAISSIWTTVTSLITRPAWSGKACPASVDWMV